MPIKYVHKDIFQAMIDNEIDGMAHGVNCSGGFGSGVAGQIAKYYPSVKQMYLEKYNQLGWGLGQVQEVPVPHIKAIGSFTIFNCATQKQYGRDPKSQPLGMYVSYEAIRECMYRLHEYLEQGKISKLGIVKIGSDLGGGDWCQIEKIINDVFSDIDIYVYVKS